MSSDSSILSGALGAVLGYLGGEVAESIIFERLLWPERFYNDWTLSIMLKEGLFLTMGGPLHAAALETLDVLRNQGLYQGSRRGNLLGTAFYSDSKIGYRSGKKRDNEIRQVEDKETRNAFWVEVGRCVNRASLSNHQHLPKFDVESLENETDLRFRTLQAVHHLTLSLVELPRPGHTIAYVREDSKTWKVLVGILSSEVIAVATAIIAIFLRGWWMSAYMLIPLVLKILALLVRVRRERLEPLEELRKRGDLDTVGNYRVFDTEHGFLVITGPPPLVIQFFRHYGHPLRHVTSGRVREVLSILLIYCFVLYFPVGLVVNIWMDDSIQYLWLAYQLYTVLAMHIVRLLGWQGCGRTEERVARHLFEGKRVCLQSSRGASVEASMWTTYVPSVASAEMTVDRIMEMHV